MKTKTPIASFLLLLFLSLNSCSALCQPTTTVVSGSGGSSLRRVILSIFFGCLSGAAAATLLLFVVRFFLQFIHRTPILSGPVTFSPSLSPKLLLSALSDSSISPQVIGYGPSGQYLRLNLDSQLILAVKLVELHSLDSNSSKRAVQCELEALAKANHWNVASLRAYIREGNRLSLVFDYFPNRSLEDIMKRARAGEMEGFGWEARRRIAAGVAMGLRYLHFECRPRILHYRLKPTNVLLDEDMEPMLTDCGLSTIVAAALVPNADCYAAPECLQSCRYTDKSDIYSFGMILGVLLTGRDPTDAFFLTEAGWGSLCSWLRHLQQSGEAREALDKSILREEVEDDEMLMAIKMALVCLSDLPADRPSSDELVAMLTQLHSF